MESFSFSEGFLTFVEAPMRSDTVVLASDVLMGYVQEFTGVGLEELHTLNPQYRTDFIPGSTGKYHITLPTGKVAAFLSHQDTIYTASRDSLSRRPVNIEPDRKVGRERGKSRAKSGSTIYHTVKKGDTLSSVARKYGISVAQLKKMNGLKKDSIRTGQRLRVRS
jgi:membrane-bound lytic murein transglycosylase D